MKDLREKCEKLNRFIADAYPNYYGVVKDLPNGDREYQPFKAKEYDEFIVSQLESFAREIRNEAVMELLEKWNEHYGHSSGCMEMFDWPFQKEPTHDCNCGTHLRWEYKLFTDALAIDKPEAPNA